MRKGTRAHVIAWRDHLVCGALALSSLFDYLNVVEGNPVTGVKRPKVTTDEGDKERSTPMHPEAARLIDFHLTSVDRGSEL